MKSRSALDRLIESSNHNDLLIEIIVVDNASADDTVTMIRDDFPTVKLVSLSENIGFAAGVNRAARAATGTYFLLLNPDTVVHPGTIQRFVHFARRYPEHGLYGGKTLWPDGSVCPGSVWGRPTAWSTFCFGTGLSVLFKHSSLLNPESLGGWKRDSVREVGVITGCLLLLSRQHWLGLGGFDERFFLYGEDVDLSLRASKMGLRPVLVPDAVITHVTGASSSNLSRRKVLVLKGQATVIHKHFSPVSKRFALAMLRIGVALRCAGGFVVRAFGGSSAAWSWYDVWTARREWVSGYPEVAASAEPGCLVR